MSNYHNRMLSSTASSQKKDPKKLVKSKKIEDLSTPTAKSCTEATNRVLKKKTKRKTTQSDTIHEHSSTNKENLIENCGDNSSYGVGKKTYKIGGKNADMFYKNEMFNSSSSTIEMKNKSQVSSTSVSQISKNSSVQDVRFVNTSDPDIFDHIKQFRTQNYFECHSLKPRFDGKMNDKDHKCTYRFYLNERLFPTPLSCNENGEVRCVECHLPINSNPDGDVNAYLQAKVSISNKILDVTMLLPLKKDKILREKSKEVKKDVLYFGILNLDGVVSPDVNEPNSLALRHEKGFKRFQDDVRYAFEPVEDDDVIII